MIHELKIQERYADRIDNQEKTFEVRKNDRDYQVGDIIEFEVIHSENDGYKIQALHPIAHKPYAIKYIHTGLGMADDYVILGIEEIRGEAIEID